MKYILFVVAGATKVHYAVLIRFPDKKISVMKGLLARIYTRTLKWAYHTPGTSGDLMSCIPDICEDVVSSKLYPITKENHEHGAVNEAAVAKGSQNHPRNSGQVEQIKRKNR